MLRDQGCTYCRLSAYTQDAEDICIPGTGSGNIVVVSRTTGGRAYLDALRTALIEVGIHDFFHTAVVKCRTFGVDATRRDMKACAPYLDEEIAEIKPQWILSLGNESLLATCGKSGIMNHRGKTYLHPSGARVFCTISPSMVFRNPGMRQGFIADLHYFASLVSGRAAEVEEIKVEAVWTVDALREFKARTETADAMAFDIESTGYDEFQQEGSDRAAIVSIAITLLHDDLITNYAIPLFHPGSPFRGNWPRVLQYVCKAVGSIPKRIGHNGKYDLRWMRQWVPEEAAWPLTFDTMLAAHLLDETRVKRLKDLARMLLGASPWAIETKDLLHTPLAEVLHYNGLDTYWTLRLWRDSLKPDLLKEPRLAKVMARLLVPASEEITEAERNGIWVDVEVLHKNWAIARANLEEIEAQLRSMIPAEHPYKIVNFNPSNFLRWWLFTHMKLPILARGKTKEDGSPGDPSVAEWVMLSLEEQGYEVARLLLDRTNWARKCGSFFGPWAQQLDADHRIHTTYKLTGTTTGRLSSGKPDAEKITAKKQVRGVNVQQVPRDPLMRGVFGEPPGWWFVQGDQSQVELRIAAMVSGERNMILHYREGMDLHMAMAMRMTGLPASAVTKEQRKRAKPVNFGFLYGMREQKFIDSSWVNYGIRFSEQEARNARKAFFDMWPDLKPWHSRQRRLAHTYKRVTSPLGRTRHLPDIDSPDRQVMAEAERQAINSPVQSLASDITLLGLTGISQHFRREGFRARVVGTVHDSILFGIPDEEMAIALPIIKSMMENPPLEQLFGFTMTVPMVADISVGHHWSGDVVELTPEQVANFSRDMVP